MSARIVPESWIFHRWVLSHSTSLHFDRDVAHAGQAGYLTRSSLALQESYK